MIKNGLPHIRFHLADAKGAPQELVSDPKYIDGGNYHRYDWYVRLNKSANEAFSLNPLMATTTGVFASTADEWQITRHPSFSSENWDKIYANALVHEIFSFGILELESDHESETELTSRTGKVDRFVSITAAELNELVKRFNPETDLK